MQKPFFGLAMLILLAMAAAVHAPNTEAVLYETAVACIDTDGGRNYGVLGTAMVKANEQSLTDHCNGDGTLTEKYCQGTGIAAEIHTCPEGCFEGACVTSCVIGGCNSELCTEGPEPAVSPCMALPMFKCYGGASCEVQADGKCGWTQTEELTRCLSGGSEPVCPAVCVPLWQLAEGKCIFNDCGSGCGPDNVKSFKTEAQCNAMLTAICNNNGVCEPGETRCGDCVGSTSCPLTKRCESGDVVTCQPGDAGCSCQPCPIPSDNLPYGCTQETDSSGLIKVTCSGYKTACPPISSDAEGKCKMNGGTPLVKKDTSGCVEFVCSFGGNGTSNPLFGSGTACPTVTEIKQKIEKCRTLGLEGYVTQEGGCNVPRCGNEKTECPAISDSDKLAMKEKCATYNKTIAVGFEVGCQKLKCVDANYCQQDLPKDVFEKCAGGGGQIIVKRDDRGCVAFSDCVQRGDTTKAYVDEVTEVPSSSELLAIAFKLEDLRMDLDKLARKSADIAEYYKTTGSTEENRFRRVATMFSDATDKVDEIRTKIRDRLDTLTKEDIREIKQDIRYLKDVVIKDILYVMLSSGDDIDKLKNNTAKSCGADGDCFGDALRICQPVSFRPDDKTAVEIRGLEDNRCVVYASAFGLDMTCKLEKYSLGTDDPESSIFPYCSGKLVDVIRKMSKQDVRPEVTQINTDSVVLPPPVPTAVTAVGSSSSGGASADACLGCFNNGICDPGECGTCADCG